jgi:hypothetical protein
MTLAKAQHSFIQLSTEDFAALGIDRVAYVKPIGPDGADGVAVHTADGNAVAHLDTLDIALATVLQNGLVPVRVH